MYDSLKNVCTDFHLYIFAFDDKAYSIIKELQPEHITVISLSEFEDPELLKIKRTRSKGEYCWTCASSTILFCIQQFDLPACTYIDADLYFYSNPKVLIDEMGDNDVQITSHRYTPEYDQTKASGKYCVQFMTFKNTDNGLAVLNWWRNACLDWCYARYEDGKFGDQMYLDDWTTRFTGIHELEHLGGGVAPWNMQQYSFRKVDSKWIGIETETRKSFDLVFFHFHAILSYKVGILNDFYLGGYKTPILTKKLLYLPYISELKKKYRTIKSSNKHFDGLATKNISLWNYAKLIRIRILKNDYNFTLWIR